MVRTGPRKTQLVEDQHGAHRDRRRRRVARVLRLCRRRCGSWIARSIPSSSTRRVRARVGGRGRAGAVGARAVRVSERGPALDARRTARHSVGCECKRPAPLAGVDLEVNIAEERPAACWGEAGLLNVDGHLFVSDVQRRAGRVAATDRVRTAPSNACQTCFSRSSSALEQRRHGGRRARTRSARGAWDVAADQAVFASDSARRLRHAATRPVLRRAGSRSSPARQNGWITSTCATRTVLQSAGKQPKPMRARFTEDGEPNV